MWWHFFEMFGIRRSAHWAERLKGCRRHSVKINEINETGPVSHNGVAQVSKRFYSFLLYLLTLHIIRHFIMQWISHTIPRETQLLHKWKFVAKTKIQFLIANVKSRKTIDNNSNNNWSKVRCAQSWLYSGHEWVETFTERFVLSASSLVYPKSSVPDFCEWRTSCSVNCFWMRIQNGIN